jgi:hypothetical protein
MVLKKKLSLGFLVLVVSSMLMSSFVFANDEAYVYLKTPYGNMTGHLFVDVQNTMFSAETSVPQTAPVVYVKAESHDYYTGNLIDGKSQTQYNTTSASVWGDTGNYRAVTVYGTHEVRGSSPYVKYSAVTEGND